MFCTVKSYPQGVSWSGFFPIKSYLQLCLGSVSPVTVCQMLFWREQLHTRGNTPAHSVTAYAVSLLF